MNILFLDQFTDLGGAQQCLLDLLPAVRERGWKASVAAPGNGALVRALRDMDVPFEPIRCGPYSSGRKSVADVVRFMGETPRLGAAIRRLAERSRADLIYVNGPRLLPAAARAAGEGRPILFHCHSRLTQRYAIRLAGWSLRRSRATVAACCRFSGEPLIPYVAPERFQVVYNGAARPRQHSPARNRNGSRRLGVVGRIAPEKGQAEFLRAARLLASDLRNCEFIVCGEALFSDPAAKEYRERLAELASGLPVEFLGWRDDADAVLSTLDLLVVPSVQEPATTRVILEAYAAGVPVVAFPSGGIPEVVADESTGFLVEPFTPEALAGRIRELLVDRPAALQQAAQAAREVWRERFTLARYRREMMAVIEQAARDG